MIEVFRNGQKVSTNIFTFNGGEEYVKVTPPKVKGHDSVVIEAKLIDSVQVMRLLMIADAVKRLYTPKHLTLKMFYIPYARQDRVCSEGESLSIKVFCDLINSVKFDKVIVSNPHSDVAPALLNNCEISDTWDKNLSQLIDTDYQPKNTVLVSPDAGALKKTYKLAEMCSGDFDIIVANNQRDKNTGRIINTSFSGDVKDKICIICDDICDYGGTFKALAKQLKEAGACKVVLAVTHGIFNPSGVDDMKEFIDKIITSDSVDYGNRSESEGYLQILKNA